MTIWEQGNLQVALKFGKFFEVAYPQKHRPHMVASRKLQMTRDKINQVSNNIFEHPTLDLHSIFSDFRLSGLLSTGHTSQVEDFLAECQSDLESLDSKIKDTISAISRLSQDLTLASASMVRRLSQIKLCEYLLSTPKYLPQDILEQIFLTCFSTKTMVALRPNEAPLQLAAVCHRWRTIALSMPTLWNGLYVDSADRVDLSKCWLNRCRLPSLTIEIDDGEVSPTKLQELLDLLKGPSLSPRKIDIIGLNGPLGDVLKKFLIDRDHAKLEQLVLRDSDVTLPIPKASTSLQRVYAYSLPEPWRHTLPPSHLTVLWLASPIHGHTLMLFLANCPNLESLYASLGEEGLRLDPEPPISKDVTHYRLRYLGIWDGYDEVEPPQDLLQEIRFPSLRIFEYSVSKRSQHSPLWLGFIHIIKPVLRLTLDFKDGLPSLDNFTRILGYAISVVELTIFTNMQFMADIIMSLTSLASRRESESLVLPSLQTLYLGTPSGDLNEWLQFKPQFIEFSSAWTNHALTELVIEHLYDDFVDGNDQNEIQKGYAIKQLLQSTCPRLCVRVICMENYSWMGEDPESFEIDPLPFNCFYIYQEMGEDPDLRWKTRLQPLHRIMC